MAKSSTILVKSKSPRGFRRAGIAFTRAGVVVDPAKLKKGQLDAIMAEPNLIVVEIEAEEESATERKAREAAEKAAADKKAQK